MFCLFRIYLEKLAIMTSHHDVAGMMITSGNYPQSWPYSNCQLSALWWFSMIQPDTNRVIRYTSICWLNSCTSTLWAETIPTCFPGVSQLSDDCCDGTDGVRLNSLPTRGGCWRSLRLYIHQLRSYCQQHQWGCVNVYVYIYMFTIYHER